MVLIPKPKKIIILKLFECSATKVTMYLEGRLLNPGLEVVGGKNC